MPGRLDYRARLAQQQLDVLERIAAGKTITAVCAQPGMPHRTTVSRWAARGEWFKDALAQAQRRGIGRRRHQFDETVARAFLARLAAGERLVSICRDPAMPGQAKLAYWRATQGAFAEDVFRIIGVHKTERRRTQRDSFRRFDEAVADRVLLHVGRGHSFKRLRRLDPTLPCHLVLNRWRRERPDFDFDLRTNMRAGLRAARRHRMAAVLDPLCDAIVEGGSINSLGGRQGLPCRQTLYRWTAASPSFARNVAKACDQREDGYGERLLLIAEDVDRLGVRETRRRMAPLSRRLGQLAKRPGKRWLE